MIPISETLLILAAMFCGVALLQPDPDAIANDNWHAEQAAVTERFRQSPQFKRAMLIEAAPLRQQ